VLLQTVQDFEIIVVDDGGADDAGAVIDEFGDSRIRYKWIDSKGISGARNVALEMSRGGTPLLSTTTISCIHVVSSGT
jgi:glycosyltransferase involved in cell wall biosynthesis